MLLVSLTDLACSLVVVDIPVFLTESQTTLRELENIVLHVLIISCEVRTERLTEANLCILKLQSLDILKVLGCFNLVHVRLYGSQSFTVTAGRVEGELIEVAEFAVGRAFSIFLLRKCSKDAADLLVHVLLQHVEGAEPTVGSRQRMEFLPSTGSKLIKVFRGLHAAVEV